jgi:hypothetical protein
MQVVAFESPEGSIMANTIGPVGGGQPINPNQPNQPTGPKEASAGDIDKFKASMASPDATRAQQRTQTEAQLRLMKMPEDQIQKYLADFDAETQRRSVNQQQEKVQTGINDLFKDITRRAGG